MNLYSKTNYSERLSPLIEETIKTHPPLSAEAEHRLFETMPREFAEQTVILHSLAYAAKVARGWNIPNATLDDVFQYVVMNMVRAIHAYDVAKCSPEMRFTGLAKIYIDRKMLLLSNPTMGSADAKMNILTRPLSSIPVLQGYNPDDSERVLDSMLRNARLSFGAKSGSTSLDLHSLDSVIESLKRFRPSLWDSKHFQRKLKSFVRSARGDRAEDIARDHQVSKWQTHADIRAIRMYILEMALDAECPPEWKWLFEKSETVRAVRAEGGLLYSQNGAPIKAYDWPYVNGTFVDDSVKRHQRFATGRRLVQGSYHEGLYAFDEKKGRTVVNIAGTVTDEEDPRITIEGKSIHKLEDKGKKQSHRHKIDTHAASTLNYDRLLTNVYQRKYRTQKHFYPERGLFYSDETHRRFLKDVSVPFSKRIYGLPGTSLFPGAESKMFCPPPQLESEAVEAEKVAQVQDTVSLLPPRIDAIEEPTIRKHPVETEEKTVEITPMVDSSDSAGPLKETTDVEQPELEERAFHMPLKCMCGRELMGDENFCPKCGRKILRCHSCEKLLAGDENFCPKCGMRVA